MLLRQHNLRQKVMQMLCLWKAENTFNRKEVEEEGENIRVKPSVSLFEPTKFEQQTKFTKPAKHACLPITFAVSDTRIFETDSCYTVWTLNSALLVSFCASYRNANTLEL